MSIKNLCFLFVLFAYACFGELSRPINETFDIVSAGRTYQRIYWVQGESVSFNLTTVNNGESYTKLTNSGTFVVWELTPTNSYSNVYFAVTGTVVNATNGQTSFYLTPAQGNLNGGTYYGFVRAFQLLGSSISNLAVLSRQVVVVGGSPSGLEYSYLPALTNAVMAEIDALQGRTNNWNFAYTVSTGDFVNVSNRMVTLEGRTSTWDTVTGKAEQVDFEDVSNRVVALEGHTNTWNAGLETNFTFLSNGTTTGQLWFSAGILTNVDLNIGD